MTEEMAKAADREAEYESRNKTEEPAGTPSNQAEGSPHGKTAEPVSLTNMAKVQIGTGAYELRLPIGKNIDNGKTVYWDPVTTTPKKTN